MGAVTGYAVSFANDNAVPPPGLLNAYYNLNPCCCRIPAGIFF